MRFSLGFNNGGEDFDSRLYLLHVKACLTGEFPNDGLVNESSSSQRVWCGIHFVISEKVILIKPMNLVHLVSLWSLMSIGSCLVKRLQACSVNMFYLKQQMRAMETVVKQNNLDIEALMSSRLPSNAGMQVGDSSSSQLAGSSQRAGITRDSKSPKQLCLGLR